MEGKMELLAAVESLDAVTAAVQSGADAVCVSLPLRGAGTAAQTVPTPGQEEFAAIVRYCLVRGCAVRAAVYGLVPETELRAVVQAAVEAARMGVEAFEVRDPGLLLALREVLPETPVCAGIRWGVHSVDGALTASRLGAQRVTLARELSMEKIAAVAGALPGGTEVIVAGPSCASCAGLCSLSGSSGLPQDSDLLDCCTFPCHREYSLGGRSDDYPLHMKKICLIRHLLALRDAGVRGAIVDARRTAPEFAADAVGICARVLRNETSALDTDLQKLERVFAPEGFTDGYLVDEAGPDMFAPPAEPERDAARYRAALRKDTARSELRRVPVDFYAMIRHDEPSCFAVSDELGNRALIYGPIPTEAAGDVLTEEKLRDELYRTGGTPYLCRNVRAAVEGDLSLPMRAVAELRQKLLDELSSLREKRAPCAERSLALSPRYPSPSEAPVFTFQVTQASQLTPELAAFAPSRIYVPLEVIDSEPERLLPFLKQGSLPAVVLPPVIEDGEEKETVRRLLARAGELGVREALVSNLGHLPLVRSAGFTPRGDLPLQTCSARMLTLLAGAGFLSAAMSPALRTDQLMSLSGPIGLELAVYGRLPVMVSRHCILKYSAGHCTCPSHGQLDDGRGGVMPVMREFGCRNVIYSARKLFLAEHLPELSELGLWGLRLMFTTESPFECVKVASVFLEDSGYRPNGLMKW